MPETLEHGLLVEACCGGGCMRMRTMTRMDPVHRAAGSAHGRVLRTGEVVAAVGNHQEGEREQLGRHLQPGDLKSREGHRACMGLWPRGTLQFHIPLGDGQCGPC